MNVQRQVAGVARGVAQHARVARRRAVVAERDAAGVGEQVVRRELVAGAVLGDRADRIDAREPGRLGPPHTSATIAAESSAGSVFGMQATAVKPPATAAAVPVAIVSLCVWPGSRRCTCMSMKPGATIAPPRIDHARVAGVEVLADRRDEPVLDQHVAQRVEPLRRDRRRVRRG